MLRADNFQEGESNIINLLEDDPVAVDSMISHMYTSEITETCEPPEPESNVPAKRNSNTTFSSDQDSDKFPEDELVADLSLFEIADKYGVVDLKESLEPLEG